MIPSLTARRGRPDDRTAAPTRPISTSVGTSPAHCNHHIFWVQFCAPNRVFVGFRPTTRRTKPQGCIGFLRPRSNWRRQMRNEYVDKERLWIVAVMFHLRDAFRSGDIWPNHSRRYADGSISSSNCRCSSGKLNKCLSSPVLVYLTATFSMSIGMRQLRRSAREEERLSKAISQSARDPTKTIFDTLV